MKKISLFLMTTLLGGCLYAGDNNILAARGDLFSALNGYSIDFVDEEPKLAKTEYIEDNNFKLNESMTAFRGYTVLNSKKYRKDTYVENFLRPTQDVVLHSASVPVKFSSKEKYRVLGVSEIDGRDYRLVDSGLKGFVVLVDEKGNLFKKMGQIKGNYLVLMDTEYYISPKGAKMSNALNTHSVQTKPTKGFDLKFDGVKMDRIWFTYLDYNNDEGNKGSFENISFPLNAGVIEINGLAFRVLKVDNDRLDYIILKNKR